MFQNLLKARGSFVIIIPVYNHEAAVASVVSSALKTGIPVIAVDDGSSDSTYEKIKNISGLRILRHEVNRGKGAAVMTGLKEALGTADYAVTIDADGQHFPEDAFSLIRALPELSAITGPRPIVTGRREGMSGPDVPWTSTFGRKFSNFWVRACGGPALSDTQTGFRIYPVKQTLDMKINSVRFQFEVEVLAKAGWLDIPVLEAPVKVSYTPGMQRISHFRPFADFMRNSRLFAGLISARILIPKFIRRRMAVRRGHANAETD